MVIPHPIQYLDFTLWIMPYGNVQLSFEFSYTIEHHGGFVPGGYGICNHSHEVIELLHRFPVPRWVPLNNNHSLLDVIEKLGIEYVDLMDSAIMNAHYHYQYNERSESYITEEDHKVLEKYTIHADPEPYDARLMGHVLRPENEYDFDDIDNGWTQV